MSPLPKLPVWMLHESVYCEKNPPLEDFVVRKRKVYYANIEDPYWLLVGYIPHPTTYVGLFFYHFVHGLWMKYPIWSVILYCFDKQNYVFPESQG